MTLALHVPGAVGGWLGRLDARWKLAAFAAACLAAAALHELWAVALALAAALALALTAPVRPGWLLRRLAPVTGLLLIFFAGPVFLPRSAEEPWVWGPLALSPRALVGLARVLGKAL